MDEGKAYREHFQTTASLFALGLGVGLEAELVVGVVMVILPAIFAPLDLLMAILLDIAALALLAAAAADSAAVAEASVFVPYSLSQ